MRKLNPQHLTRTSEELRKLGSTPAEISRILRIDSETARRWLAGDALPSLGGLEILYRAGVDIMYIITGVRVTQDIPRSCETCAHYCDGFYDVCESHDYDCGSCPNNDTCRTCQRFSNWHWRFQPLNTYRE